jgi:hypothetical protein
MAKIYPALSYKSGCQNSKVYRKIKIKAISKIIIYIPIDVLNKLPWGILKAHTQKTP